MKTALVLILSASAALFAQEPKPVSDRNPGTDRQQEGPVKKLGSVTWNPQAHKLAWVVQMGSMVGGEFVPASEQKYEISPDEAKMKLAEEERGLDPNEAVSLHKLLDILSIYCAESVVWWEDGQGTSPAPKATPTKEQDRDTGSKPVRVNDDKPKEAPKYQVPAGRYIANAAQVK